MKLIYTLLKDNFKYVVLLILGLIIYIQYINYSNVKIERDISINNNKAYEKQISSLKNEANLYLLTIDDIEYSKDSINKKLLQTAKELKIKNDKLVQMQYIKDSIYISDTILVKDTIFKEDLKLDTVITKPFYTINLSLNYPNNIVITPSLVNEKIVLFSNKRETIKPPHKWWIKRIFQKKHTIVEVDIKDSNPYVKTTQSKFINIISD